MQDEFESAYQGCSGIEASFHAEGKYSAKAIPEILARKFMVRIVFQTDIVHTLDCRVVLEELCYCKCIGTAALCSQREGFQTLEHQE
jgi:hypothetical protein